MSRLGIVVVRFGHGINGGAELHARLVGMRLAERGHDVTVLTTCAEDYVSWANVLPAGESHDGPLRVLRFPVRAERDLSRWEQAMQPLLEGMWDDHVEQVLLREQGPDSPALLDHLAEHSTSYDAIIFFTLLYLPSVAGIPLAWDRAILVPTLHDELCARLDAQARALRLARCVLWNTPEERELAGHLYGARDIAGAVAGIGVEVATATAAEIDEVRARFGLTGPYLLYAGRIDPEKGCGEMFDAFTAWSQQDGRADLVLAGRAWMDVPTHPRIRQVGYLDSADLRALMSDATATVIPSRNESLSMAALESLACGTPILVTGDSPVLTGHARRSAAGLIYRSPAEFGALATLLLEHPETRSAWSAAATGYVDAHFSWSRVMAVYDDAIDAVTRTATRAKAPA